MRIFLAIELPENVKDKLVDVQKELAPQLPEVRCEKREKLHITLVFLGDVEEHRLAGLEEAVSKSLRSLKKVELHLGNLGGFPNLRRPGAIWVGIEEKFKVKSSNVKVDPSTEFRAGGQEPEAGRLVELVRNLKKSLREAGFEVDKKPFHPHVTIGRVARPKFPREFGVVLWRISPPGGETTGGLRSTQGLEGVEFEVDSVSIIKSELRLTGSVYTRLAQIPLITRSS